VSGGVKVGMGRVLGGREGRWGGSCGEGGRSREEEGGKGGMFVRLDR